MRASFRPFGRETDSLSWLGYPGLRRRSNARDGDGLSLHTLAPNVPKPYSNITILWILFRGCRALLNLDLKPFVGPITDAIRAEASKFSADPKQARDGFDAVFDALEQTLQAVDGELASLGNLGLQEGCTARTTAVLRDFASGKFLSDLSRARYRCGKLYEIYLAHIKTYVDVVLSPERAAELKGSFDLLKSSDYGVVDRLQEINQTITQAASDMLGACAKGDVDGARRRFASLEQYIIQARKQLREDLAELSDARAALNSSLRVPFRPDVDRIVRKWKLPLALTAIVLVFGLVAWLFVTHNAKKWYDTQQKPSPGVNRVVIGGPFSGRDECRLDMLRAVQIGAQLSSLQCAQYDPNTQVGDQL
jgi:hypothetical protein